MTCRASPLFFLTLFLLIGPGTPPPAVAEDDWNFSLAGYSGRAMTGSPDVGVKQPLSGLDGEALGVNLGDSIEFGGRITGWHIISGRARSMDLGVALDVTSFSSDLPIQTVEATGRFGPFPLGSVTFLVPFDIRSHIVAINVLWRYPLGVSTGLPHGRWYPYFGLGGGISFSRMRIEGGPWRSDTAPLLQGLVGAKVFLARHLALFGEYKRSHATHDFDFASGLFELKVSLDVNHFVGGVAFHF